MTRQPGPNSSDARLHRGENWTACLAASAPRMAARDRHCGDGLGRGLVIGGIPRAKARSVWTAWRSGLPVRDLSRQAQRSRSGRPGARWAGSAAPRRDHRSGPWPCWPACWRPFGLRYLYYSAAGVRDGIIADLAARGVGKERSQLSLDQRREVRGSACATASP